MVGRRKKILIKDWEYSDDNLSLDRMPLFHITNERRAGYTLKKIEIFSYLLML